MEARIIAVDASSPDFVEVHGELDIGKVEGGNVRIPLGSSTDPVGPLWVKAVSDDEAKVTVHWALHIPREGGEMPMSAWTPAETREEYEAESAAQWADVAAGDEHLAATDPDRAGGPESKPMRADELGRYVCVAQGGCLHSPHRTIREDGVWVKAGTQFSSAHRDCFEAWHREETR